MRILNTQEVLLQPTDTLFGPSKIKAIIVFLICLFIFVLVQMMTFNEGQWLGRVLFSLIGVVILLATGSRVVQTFRKDSWQIAVRTDAVLVKADITGEDSRDILEIPFREIASLRKLREQYYIYRRRKKHYYLSRVRMDALDIELTQDSYAQLSQLGAAKAAGLEMAAPNRLIYPAGALTMNVDRVIAQLQNECRVEQDHEAAFEKPNLKDKQQVDDYILLLARRNNSMAARRWAHQAFGYDREEAKNYITNLLQNA